MSYHIYTTEGIILKRASFGEANILLYILTADLGLIIAGARSARLSVSKLRPALQEYSRVVISCIKGKNGWKVTNAVDNGSFYYDCPEFAHKTLSSVSSLILKMIPGEDPHREIFEIVNSGFAFMKSVGEENISNLEVLLVFRILKELGYVVSDDQTKVFLEDTHEWNVDLLGEVAKSRLELVALINKALKESHL